MPRNQIFKHLFCPHLNEIINPRPPFSHSDLQTKASSLITSVIDSLERLRPLLLRYVGWRICILDWLHRLLPSPLLQKVHPRIHLHNHHTDPVLIFLWGFARRDDATHPTLGLRITISKGPASVTYFHCSYLVVHSA